MMADVMPTTPLQDGDVDTAARERNSNIDAIEFITALAVLLNGTVARFGETASRVTDSLITQVGKADRDLIVTLQDFDRLQQEFVALGAALERCAAALGQAALAGHDQTRLGHDVIAAIAVSDLKDRLLRHLQAAATDLSPPQVDDEEVF